MFKKKPKPRNIAEICDDFKCTVTDTMSYTAHTTLLILKTVPASTRMQSYRQDSVFVVFLVLVPLHPITVLKKAILHSSVLLLKYVKFAIVGQLLCGLGVYS